MPLWFTVISEWPMRYLIPKTVGDYSPFLFLFRFFLDTRRSSTMTPKEFISPLSDSTINFLSFRVYFFSCSAGEGSVDAIGSEQSLETQMEFEMDPLEREIVVHWSSTVPRVQNERVFDYNIVSSRRHSIHWLFLIPSLLQHCSSAHRNPIFFEAVRKTLITSAGWRKTHLNSA